jgi:shikimate kinase
MKPIFLTGYMGSGKTTIGKTLADILGIQFIDLDKFIEQKYNRTISDIFTLEGETRFREIERECLCEVAKYEDAVIATGGGTPCFFDNMHFINKNGKSIYLKLSVNQLTDRLKQINDGTRPLIAKLNDTELENHIAEQLEKREPYYKMAHNIVEAADIDTCANRIIEKLKRKCNKYVSKTKMD